MNIPLPALAAFALSLAASAAFGLFFLRTPPSLKRALLKTAAVAALAAGLFFLPHTHVTAPLVAALALSALGDFFLALDKPLNLALGIAAFLIAQLLYTFLMGAIWLQSGATDLLIVRNALQIAIIAFAIGWLIWLWRDLKAMTGPVIVYLLAISAMAVMAMLLPARAWPAMVGALLFLTSDCVLALELFKLPTDGPARRFTAPVVWWTYYAAQICIPLGLILAAHARA